MKKIVSIVLLSLVCFFVMIAFSACDLFGGGGPSVPTGVAATQGTYADYVRITWDGNASETYYIYRSTNQSTGFAKISSAVAGSSYDDDTVELGVHYWYAVSAADVYGDSETDTSTAVEGWTIVPSTLAVDVKEYYFNTLNSTSLDVYVNNVKVGTINKSELGTASEYSQFQFTFPGTITSLKIFSGGYTDIFDEIDDFASNPPGSVTSMAQIKKVVLYPSENWITETVNGTGAYIGPKKPFFTVSGATDNSIDLNVSEYESPTNLTFNIYLSTDGGTTFTKYNSSAVGAADIYDGYTVTGLSQGMDYTINIESVHGGITSVRSNDKSFTTTGSRWTVMVWLDGDNNLNANAILDFHEMEYGLYLAEQDDTDLTDKLNVIVQYDSNPDYNTASATPGRYKVQPSSTLSNQYVDFSNSVKVQSLAEPNMGSASELASFITYCKTNYPAENYALILWNHGGGVRAIKDTDNQPKAICWDDTDDGDTLYVGEIKDFLDSSHSVDFLGMDACLMGFLEVAYEFRPGTGDFGAEAITFSPATEQGDGWEYDAIFSRLNGQDGNDGQGHPYYAIETLTSQEIARVVVEEYEDAFLLDTWETSTAVDLNYISEVKSAADAFATTLAPYQSGVENIRGAVGSGNLMAYFDESILLEWMNYAGFDLYELAEQVKANSVVGAVNTAADNLMDKVDDAIIYSWAQSSYDSGYGTGYEQGKNGLAIFFPDGDALYDSVPYWAYQHWYNGVSNADYEAWWGSMMTSDPPQYGALDFCTSDGDGNVESWFELLQYWFNPSTATPNGYNPSPLE